ncbi:Hypothetical protein FKW44_004592 [Caligus rogercresseyi]|uniref:Uncharacterized protein n=1 Tax=Caligus rogercresseyi TaxID=217165 RepID=A0A7T8KB31_CALRO|nr:Hypothetical protein FKW44_004592 [Caligus rogercresseyi]
MYSDPVNKLYILSSCPFCRSSTGSTNCSSRTVAINLKCWSACWNSSALCLREW